MKWANHYATSRGYIIPILISKNFQIFWHLTCKKQISQWSDRSTVLKFVDKYWLDLIFIFFKKKFSIKFVLIKKREIRRILSDDSQRPSWEKEYFSSGWLMMTSFLCCLRSFIALFYFSSIVYLAFWRYFWGSYVFSDFSNGLVLVFWVLTVDPLFL